MPTPPKKPNPRRIDIDKLPEHIRKLNPHLYVVPIAPVVTRETLEVAMPPPREKPPKMNKTESRWRDIMDAKLRRGDINEWDYEPITLRLADKTTYTPDFVSVALSSPLNLDDLRDLFALPASAVIGNDHLASVIQSCSEATQDGKILAYADEIKGGMIWEKNRIKFKVARENYPWIEFRLWQWKRGEWTQIY